MENIISITSCVIAIIALLLSFLTFRWSYRTSIRPILVFFNDDADPQQNTTWSVQNVGNGPALNVEICGGWTLEKLDPTVCARLPALAPSAKERLSYLKTRCAFVATYSDLTGAKFTTTSYDSRNHFYHRNRYPDLVANLPHAWAKRQTSKAPQQAAAGDGDKPAN